MRQCNTLGSNWETQEIFHTAAGFTGVADVKQHQGMLLSCIRVVGTWIVPPAATQLVQLESRETHFFKHKSCFQANASNQPRGWEQPHLAVVLTIHEQYSIKPFPISSFLFPSLLRVFFCCQVQSTPASSTRRFILLQLSWIWVSSASRVLTDYPPSYQACLFNTRLTVECNYNFKFKQLDLEWNSKGFISEPWIFRLRHSTVIKNWIMTLDPGSILPQVHLLDSQPTHLGQASTSKSLRPPHGSHSVYIYMQFFYSMWEKSKEHPPLPPKDGTA